MNIKIKDERCFGYTLLYFIDPLRNSNDATRASLYTGDALPQRTIRPFVADSTARRTFLQWSIRHNYKHWYFRRRWLPRSRVKVIKKLGVSARGSHLNWNGHDAPIENIDGRLSNYSKRKQRIYMCVCCISFFESAKVLSRHKKLCTPAEYIAVFDQLPVNGTKCNNMRFTDYN